MKKYMLFVFVCIMWIVFCSSILGCSLIFGFFPEDPLEIKVRYARSAYDNQNYSGAEKLYKEVQKESEENGVNVGGMYGTLSWIYSAQGLYHKAIDARMIHWRLHKNPKMYRLSMSSESCIVGDLYLYQGKNAKAYEYYSKAFEHAEELKKSEPHNYGIAHIFPHLGMYYIQQDDYKKAIEYYQKHLKFFIEEKSLRADKDGRARMRLAYAYFYVGDDQQASELVENSIQENINSFIVWEEDLAKCIKLQSRIKEHIGEIEKSRWYLLKALEVLSEKDPSRYRTQQAEILNSKGQFFIRQWNIDEALNSFQKAIQLRQETGTSTHPDYADSLKGLADVAVARDEMTSATTSARQALDVLDNVLVSSHPRIAPTLVALASLNLLTGQADQAELAFQRLEAILQGPLGMYREDIQDTLAFYRKVLQQKGNESGAMRLVKLSKMAELRKDKVQRQ